MLAVEFAVVGAGDGSDLLVEDRNLVGFQAGCEVAGQRAFVEGRAGSHHDKQFQGHAHDGMLGS